MAITPLLRHAARTEWRVLTLMLCLTCLGLGLQNGLGRPDATLYDYLLTADGGTDHADSLIIAIDERSLEALGRWPWPRGTHARMLERLGEARPKAIGLDLILSESDGANDALLATALKRVPAVLPLSMDLTIRGGQREFQAKLPVPALIAAATALGHIHTTVDADGIARGVFLREGLYQPPPDIRTWSHFALAMLMVGDPAWRTAPLPGARNPVAPVAGIWSRDYEIRIPFPGPRGRVARVSYVDVLEGRVPSSAFDGKYVFVGATAAGLGDAYPTPISGRSRLTPGVEIHAYVLAALRAGKTISLASAPANALFNLVPLLLLMVGIARASPRRALALTATALVALPMASAVALLFGVWFAPTAGLLCIAAAYPLWSWRRLEATVRYLGEEFKRLADLPRVLPEAPLPVQAGDLVEARMQAVAGAADRLRQLRRFVSTTLESLPDAALVTDRDGRVLIANRAAATLFDAAQSSDLRAREMTELVGHLAGRTEHDAAPDWDAIKRLAEPLGDTGENAADPHRPALECASRQERNLLARCARLDGDDDTPAGWIVSFSDISELRQAERAREEVLAFLSHDMRSPQSSIIALLELHELDPDDNPKEEVHTRIEHYARRTLSLSEQFLQLARAETKAHEPVIEDLGALAEEACDDVWTAASQKSIRLELKWDGEPLPVLADRALLLRAIVNLLTNAVKYSPENTVVTVSVAEREIAGKPMHICEVADQGYGISAENQARLFERYRRFSEPGQPKAQGAGLGMAFVKTVLEKHGGGIGVKSETGRGSTFTLILPPVSG